MRGEQLNTQAPLRLNIGSSPHAWGTVPLSRLQAVKTRVIPTCVGNSATGTDSQASWPGHPHMRGEQLSRRAA